MKFISKLLILIMMVSVLPLSLPQAVSAEQAEYYIDFTIDFSSLDGIKIGERARNVSIDVDAIEITASTNLTNRAFTDGKKGKEVSLNVRLDKNSMQIRGNSEHGSEFISLRNTFMADVIVSANGVIEQLEVNTHRIVIRVNGVEEPGSNINVSSITYRTEGGSQESGAIGETVTDFRVSINCAFEFTGRTYYKIKKANDKKIDPTSDIGWNMPVVAEPGVKITFYDCLYGAGISDKVEYHTINGERIDHEQSFIMPERDVEVSIVLKGEGGSGGGGSTAQPKLVKELNINFDIKAVDKDIYNGKKAPNADDVKKAVSVTTDQKGCSAKVSYSVVDEIYDESFYA